MRKRVCLLILMNFLTITISGQELHNLFSTLSKNNIFNGSVVVSAPGEKIFSECYGFSNIEKKQKISDTSQFPIASVTKTFTATAILQLKQKGKLAIDDPVQKYLPDFPYPNITIKHLLNNTSGLEQYYTLFDTIMKEQPEKIFTNQDIIPTLIRFKTPLSFLPGSKWEYNNVNFCLAAMVIEKVSGMRYGAYLEKNIFIPAKMENSFVPDNRKIKKENQVELYAYPNLYSTNPANISTLKEPFPIFEKSNFYGNGGIVSTALDLQKYHNALFTYQILNKKELEEALTATKLNDGKTATFQLEGKEISYGLGWAMYTNEKHGKIVFHDGSITGLTSILMHNMTTNQTVVLLANRGNSPVFSISDAVFQLINHKPYTIPAQNLSRIYGSLLESGNQQKANQLIQEYVKDRNGYEVTEIDFNRLGYQFLRIQKIDNALQVFHAAIVIFPKSSNAYDSYGEALLQAGKKEEAMQMYQKAVELDPESTNAKEMVKKIEGLLAK